MDKQFTNKLAAYMRQPLEQRNIEEGAKMLLQLNGNRILYKNIITRPQAHCERLMYYLEKFLRERTGGECEPATKPTVQTFARPQTPHGFKGQRADHDALPEEIKALWVENGTLRQQKRALHEKLKLTKTAEERLPVLSEMVAKDKQYFANWERYDGYKADVLNSANVESNASPSAPPVPSVDVKKVSAARKYISDNKAKLSVFKADAAQLVKYTELKAKMQQRLDYLVSSGQTVGTEQAAELSNLGLNV